MRVGVLIGDIRKTVHHFFFSSENYSTLTRIAGCLRNAYAMMHCISRQRHVNLSDPTPKIENSCSVGVGRRCSA